MMKIPYRFIVLCSVFIFFLFTRQATAVNKPVEVVFCMDLSGSTNGLIDDFRGNMWDIILQFKAFKPAPDLRIGMVGYSRPSFGKATGYSKVISPLTNDFDQLSYDLFNVKPYIEKGDQLVGAALQMAVKGINWSKDADAIKIIFVIGNGAVQLGSVDFRAACDEAALKHILIYPVFCTKANKSKEITGWLEIARLSGTEMKEIYIHKQLDIVPVCKSISLLKEASDRYTKSYMYYGDDGYNKLKLLKGADANASLGGNLNYEARVFYKMKYFQAQGNWDLVDYMQLKGELPEFDHNSLADSLKMIPDENLKRSVLAAKSARDKSKSMLNNLLPSDRQQQILKQRIEKNLEKIETLEMIVVETYFKVLIAKGFQPE